MIESINVKCCMCPLVIDICQQKGFSAYLCWCNDIDLATCVNHCSSMCAICKKQRNKKINYRIYEQIAIKSQSQKKIKKQQNPDPFNVPNQNQINICISCQRKVNQLLLQNGVPICSDCALVIKQKQSHFSQKRKQSSQLKDSHKNNSSSQSAQKSGKSDLKRKNYVCSSCGQQFYESKSIKTICQDQNGSIYICFVCQKDSLEHQRQIQLTNSKLAINKSKFKMQEEHNRKKQQQRVLANRNNNQMQEQHSDLQQLKEKQKQKSQFKQDTLKSKTMPIDRKKQIIQENLLNKFEGQKQIQQQSRSSLTDTRMKSLVQQSHIQRKRKYQVQQFQDQETLNIELEELKNQYYSQNNLENKFQKKQKISEAQSINNSSQMNQCLECNYVLPQKNGSFFDLQAQAIVYHKGKPQNLLFYSIYSKQEVQLIINMYQASTQETQQDPFE